MEELKTGAGLQTSGASLVIMARVWNPQFEAGFKSLFHFSNS